MNIDQAAPNSPVAGQVATAATMATAGDAAQGDEIFLKDMAHDIALDTLGTMQWIEGQGFKATATAIRVLELAAAELRGGE